MPSPVPGSPCCSCTRRRGHGTSTATSCRCSQAGAGRSRWTPRDSATRPASVGEESIERWALAAAELLEALEPGPRSSWATHEAYVAVELGVAHPERVKAVVLSSLHHLATKEEREAQLRSPPPVDHVDRRDGSHLADLWRQRAPFYPPDAGLLDRYVVDCLKAGDLAAEGHRIVAGTRPRSVFTCSPVPSS